MISLEFATWRRFSLVPKSGASGKQGSVVVQERVIVVTPGVTVTRTSPTPSNSQSVTPLPATNELATIANAIKPMNPFSHSAATSSQVTVTDEDANSHIQLDFRYVMRRTLDRSISIATRKVNALKVTAASRRRHKSENMTLKRRKKYLDLMNSHFRSPSPPIFSDDNEERRSSLQNVRLRRSIRSRRRSSNRSSNLSLSPPSRFDNNVI